MSTSWLGASLAFAHLALDSTRPRAFDLHGWLATGAVAATALSVATLLGRGARMRALSAVAAMLTSATALVLIVGRAAHETGVALLVVSLVIAVVSVIRPEEGGGLAMAPDERA